MKKRVIAAILLGLFICCDKPASQTQMDEMKMPTADEIIKIQEAVPPTATVQALKARKLLVFSLAWGYKHNAVSWGIEAIKTMADKSGVFEAVISDDISMFEKTNLQGFDAVVFNNTNEEIFLPENFKDLSPDEQKQAESTDSRLKENFVNFLQSGKGLAVIHAGLACFREWPEYGEIIGARFDNHPWNSGSTISVKVDDPAHPLNKAFTNPRFLVTDEIYQVTGDYSRENLRVLLSIDAENTDISSEKVHRKDGDLALSWIKNYGKGRVFYFAFGHDHPVYWQPMLMQHLQDGLQFVLGDLPCDTTPSAAITSSGRN